MNSPLAATYALRSLFRHRRRAILSIVGIGVGCAICLFMVSFVQGEGEMMMRAAAESGTGHLQAAPKTWLRTRDKHLRLTNWEKMAGKIREMENVSVAAPHARTDALLAMGTRTAGVVMTGVDPQTEPHLNRLVHKMEQGNYLDAAEAGAVVIGRTVAERLNVEIEDMLVVTVSGKNDEINSAMLRVQGIVSTGSRILDAGLCHVLLSDLTKLTGFPGATEISILLKNPGLIEKSRTALANMVPPDAQIITWKEIVPELASGIEVDKMFTRIMVGIVITVVFLGIASAQLAAALERRKEFAILSAIGMRGGQLIKIMLVEGIILGVLGSCAALLIGTPAVFLLSLHGLDLGVMYGDADLSVSNILIDPILYGSFDWWLLPMAISLALGASVLSSFYPAWYACGTDPAEALRVDR